MATIFYHNKASPSTTRSSTFLSIDVTYRQDFFFSDIETNASSFNMALPLLSVCLEWRYYRLLRFIAFSEQA